MAVKITLDITATKVTKIYQIEGADPISVYPGSATMFNPRKVELRFMNGELGGATVYGPRTLKDGSNGVTEHERTFRIFDIRKWPEWLQTLVRSATP